MYNFNCLFLWHTVTINWITSKSLFLNTQMPCFCSAVLNPPGQLSADRYSMVKLGRTACFYRKTVTFKTSHHAPRVFLVKQLLLGSKPHGATSITTQRPVPLENPPRNFFQETTGFWIFQRTTGTIFSACWYELNYFLWVKKKKMQIKNWITRLVLGRN